MTARRVALVAWELGAGRGHLEHLRPVVAALLADGWTVVAAVRDLAAGRAVFDTIDPALRGGRFMIGQAPIFVHRATPPPVRPSSLAEILAHAGFGDAALLRPVIGMWEHLLATVKPDVVVADFAPGVAAAAYGRIPVIATGNGWTIPPDGSPVPALPISPRDADAAIAAEERICDAVAAASTGSRRPDRFVRLLRGDARFIYTAALLDPYRATRRDALSCPPSLTIPRRRKTNHAAPAILYLPPHHPAIAPMLDAVEELGLATLAYMGGIAFAAPANVTVTTRPIDLATSLPGAPLAIHHGGLGTANWCLACGVSQVIVPRDLEKSLTAHAIATHGAGDVILPGSGTDVIAPTLQRALAMVPPTSPTGFEHAAPDETTRAIVVACHAART